MHEVSATHGTDVVSILASQGVKADNTCTHAKLHLKYKVLSVDAGDQDKPTWIIAVLLAIFQQNLYPVVLSLPLFRPKHRWTHDVYQALVLVCGFAEKECKRLRLHNSREGISLLMDSLEPIKHALKKARHARKVMKRGEDALRTKNLPDFDHLKPCSLQVFPFPCI